MACNNVISFQTSQEYSKMYEADFQQLPKKVCISIALANKQLHGLFDV